MHFASSKPQFLHEEIEAWKKQNALENTQKNRPDLMKNYLKKSKNE